MRGDSVRDFYAKALAILGLGLLAGVGALVDYWPVAAGTPALVAGPALGPALPSLPRFSDLPPLPPRPRVVAAVRSVAPPPVPVSIVAVASTGAGPVGEPVPLVAPLEFIAPVVVPAVEAPAAPVELSVPAPIVEFVPALTPPPTRLAASAQDDSGFIMGALKKTGAGIVKTGAVTGASIADAFRGVVGAFKKVSPFKDRGFGAE